MDEHIFFGDWMIPAKLLGRTKIAQPGLSISLPPVEKLKTTIKEALKNPLGMPPQTRVTK